MELKALAEDLNIMEEVRGCHGSSQHQPLNFCTEGGQHTERLSEINLLPFDDWNEQIMSTPWHDLPPKGISIDSVHAGDYSLIDSVRVWCRFRAVCYDNWTRRTAPDCEPGVMLKWALQAAARWTCKRRTLRQNGDYHLFWIMTLWGWTIAVTSTTRSSAIAERPHCRVHYSFGQNWKTGTERQYFTDRSNFNHCDIIGLKIYRIRWKKQNKGYA